MTTREWTTSARRSRRWLDREAGQRPLASRCPAGRPSGAPCNRPCHSFSMNFLLALLGAFLSLSLSAQAQRLMSVFTRAGYELVAPAIIQPMKAVSARVWTAGAYQRAARSAMRT